MITSIFVWHCVMIWTVFFGCCSSFFFFFSCIPNANLLFLLLLFTIYFLWFHFFSMVIFYWSHIIGTFPYLILLENECIYFNISLYLVIGRKRFLYARIVVFPSLFAFLFFSFIYLRTHFFYCSLSSSLSLINSTVNCAYTWNVLIIT